MSTLSVTPEKVGSADVGIVGLGTMGGNLVLNCLDKGFTVAVYNNTTAKTEQFLAEHGRKYGPGKLVGGATYADFAKLLKAPRKALVLVTAGPVTDIVINELTKVFDKNDVIVDTGNAHFRDQSGRAEKLEGMGLRFLGMGISGGAEGARKGPAFFPGGTLSVWNDIKHIVEAASAKASDGRPCVTMCGKGGAGSCVKMYHNAGEYAVLQIWAEAYATLRGLGLTSDAVQRVLASWKAKGDLDSYMLDITYEVAGQRDELSRDGSLLVEHTADMIGSKGTGLWSVQEALGVAVPVPTLAAAVVARQMTMVRPERLLDSKRLPSVKKTLTPTSSVDAAVDDLYWATYLSIVASYAQMFQSLRGIDSEFKLEMMEKMPRIISTFRAGCILQGAMLEPMTRAFEKEPNIPNLMCAFQKEVNAGMEGFRRTCAMLAMSGEAAGCMQASLTYITTMTQTTLIAGQCVALQRDVFGRHGFKRLTEDGKASDESYNATWRELQ